MEEDATPASSPAAAQINTKQQTRRVPNPYKQGREHTREATKHLTTSTSSSLEGNRFAGLQDDLPVDAKGDNRFVQSKGCAGRNEPHAPVSKVATTVYNHYRSSGRGFGRATSCHTDDSREGTSSSLSLKGNTSLRPGRGHCNSAAIAARSIATASPCPSICWTC